MKANAVSKPLFFFSVLLLLAIVSCTNTNSTDQPITNTIPEEQKEEVKIDSLALALHELDSIMNSGQLVHLDVYELGKLKSISVSVQKITSKDQSLAYINFRKDCGGQYYYSWEDAKLLGNECNYFIDAMNVIIENKNREVDHEERYAYVTKDDLRLLSSATKGNNWQIEFSLDYRKDNSTVSLSDKEIENLKELILQGQKKIREIE